MMSPIVELNCFRERYAALALVGLTGAFENQKLLALTLETLNEIAAN